MNVLIVAAHPDDDVLGCGGAMDFWAAEGHFVHVHFAVDGETSRGSGCESDRGQIESRNAAAHSVCKILGCKLVELLGLPGNRLDRLELLDVVQQFESIIDRLRPEMVLTHHSGDVNIDHRIVHDAVLAVCRPQPKSPARELLFLEVPFSTEWRSPSSAMPFLPNYCVDISVTLKIKFAALDAYVSELWEFPHPRSLRAVEALARWRGATVGVEAAEAFILDRKLVSSQVKS